MPTTSLSGPRRLLAALVIPVLALAARPAPAATPAETLRYAREVLEQIMSIPEQAIPPSLLGGAQAIAVVPNVVKLGFIVGGRYGKGVLLARAASGGWSDPVFVSLAGGSIGWQIGAQSSDVILVFKNRRSLEGLNRGKFTLGADASVAAGPVGRNAAAATDAELKSEIYSYSRSRGAFAGIALDGSALSIDDEANAAYYGRPGITAAEILAGKAPAGGAEARALRAALAKYAGAGK